MFVAFSGSWALDLLVRTVDAFHSRSGVQAAQKLNIEISLVQLSLPGALHEEAVR